MSAPLITYSPRYREVGTIEYKESPYINGLLIPGATKGTFLIKFPIQPPGAIVPPGTIGAGYAVYLTVNEDLSPEFIRNFYIVFAAVSFAQITYSTQRTVFLIDNNGNKYHIPAALQPGTQLPSLGVPMDTTSYFSFFSFPLITKNSVPLPDSFIDEIITHQSEVLSRETHTYVGPTRWIIAQPNPPVDVIPHRAFQPTRDLADYIEMLEKGGSISKKGMNMNTQTNAVNKGNMNTQTNNAQFASVNVQTNSRNGFVNALRKTCRGKNCNAVNTGIQTNTNTNRRNRNGFVNTLRKTCRGKNCNAANTGVQTNVAAYTGRRHSMVNALRRTVKSTRPTANTP